MKDLNILFASSIALIVCIVVGTIYIHKNDKSFFPSEVLKGVLVCHDPIGNRPVFIPFEKFPELLILTPFWKLCKSCSV